MSTRTLIEINHDYLNRIERNLPLFNETLLRVVKRVGTPRMYRDSVDYLHREFGTTFKFQRHHSDPCPVAVFLSPAKAVDVMGTIVAFEEAVATSGEAPPSQPPPASGGRK